MGISNETALLLRSCRAAGVDFRRTLMLGRQEFDGGGYAEPLFTSLGAESVDSLDASPFEGATLLADLNEPLPQGLRRTFTAVFDGGTLEHVFDVPTALRSTLDLVEQGGHYIAVSPANNWPGHGFYQFSPELYFRMLSPASGFCLRAAFVIEHRRTPRWFRVSDPVVAGERVAWRGRFRSSIAVVAQRVDIVELTSYNPQQSDYVRRWATLGGQVPAAAGRHWVRSVLRPFARGPVLTAYNWSVHRWRDNFDRRHFSRVRPTGVTRVLQGHG